MAQALKLVEAFDLGQGPADALNTRAMHLIAEAEKLAFADRDHYVGDPDFVRVPIGLLDAGYLAARRTLIDPQTAMGRPSPGTPPQAERPDARRRRDRGDGGHQPYLHRRRQPAMCWP